MVSRSLIPAFALFNLLHVSSSGEGLATTSFNTEWFKVVISIEGRRVDGTPVPAGTGFLVEAADKLTVLVTAAHVVRDPDTLQMRPSLFYVRTDYGDGNALVEDQRLVADGLGPWFFSDSLDLAVRYFYWPGGPVRMTIVQQAVFLPRENLGVGASLLVLGFPLGLRSGRFKNPIARKAMIAGLDDTHILLDGLVFPGNSGGPERVNDFETPTRRI